MLDGNVSGIDSVRLYLDNCALNRPYDDQSGARVRLEAESVQLILEALECGRLDMVWSFVLDIENDQNPFEERRTGVARWKPFAVEIVNDVNEVQSRAEHLVTLGFKPVDALHL